MGNHKKTIKILENQGTGATARDAEFEADVLFQRIYDKWYAFTVVEDDCLVTQVPEKEVQKRMQLRKTAKAA